MCNKCRQLTYVAWQTGGDNRGGHRLTVTYKCITLITFDISVRIRLSLMASVHDVNTNEI